MVVTTAYVPDRGDVVWIDFNPHTGHEQAGHRPALVVSPKSYNRRVGLALFCPITSEVKGYPFEVTLPEDLAVRGVVLSDQLKSLDWRARRAKRIGRLPDNALEEAVGKMLTLIDPTTEDR